MLFNIQNSFTSALPADSLLENKSRQVEGAGYSYVIPRKPSSPRMLHFATELAADCGFTEEDMQSERMLYLLSGSEIHSESQPYAMCYGGHQFGHWAGQLGDGRAINLFEHIHNNKRFSFQLKGAGPTPYSRNADGLAVLRSSIREYLCSEAMHYLGIPTTRALSIITTGDEVLRDVMYDGHPAMEKGAIVCRLAPSFIRFGNFEIFASRNDIKNLKLLTDYTIQYFYPHITSNDATKYLDFFKEVSKRTLELMLNWQRVGFVHGVMNTDNMSILGLTIDYGPYGWLEDYDPNWTPNTTDAQGKRYRYGNQGNIALWNLVQLANALYPLIEDVPALEEVLGDFHTTWEERYPAMHASKLGLNARETDHKSLALELTKLLAEEETDMTIFYRQIALTEKTMINRDVFQLISPAFYNLEVMTDEIKLKWQNWIDRYLICIKADTKSDQDRRTEMNKLNPKYVLRNYMAQLAIDGAEKEDYSVLNELYTLLKKPYDEQPEYEKWFAKRPEWARTKIGCSMLSCSS
jgi:uncharacterized protein YdiU (UPF0061 family)